MPTPIRIPRPKLPPSAAASAVRLLAAAAARPGLDAPGRVVDNAELATLHTDACDRVEAAVGTRPPACDPDFAADRAGVLQRTVLERSWTVRDLAVEAARRALTRSALDHRRIGAVLVSSTAPEEPVPSMAATVQGTLGLPESIPALDLAVGCSGFVAAVDLASRLLAGQPRDRFALVIGAETMLRCVDFADRSTAALFGDAAGAVVIGLETQSATTTTWRTCGRQWQDIVIGTSGAPSNRAPYRLVADQGRALIEEHPVHRACLAMRGRTVFRDVVRLVPEVLQQHFDALDLRPTDIALLALHQANSRMLDGIRNDPRVGLEAERVPSTLAHTGNTSSASIPLVLADAFDRGALRDGDLVTLGGFGAGLAVAVTTLQIGT